MQCGKCGEGVAIDAKFCGGCGQEVATSFGGQNAEPLKASTETCPFCGTSIVPEAIVCRGCGANKGPAGSSWKAWQFIIIGIFFLFGASAMKVSVSGDPGPIMMGGMGFGLLILGAYLLNKYKKIVWSRRMS
jgi:hypothetical protein